MTLKLIRKQIRELADPKIAEISQRFFKTGPGEYGEGDRFIGIRVPMLRKLVKAHKDISIETSQKLLTSAVHEERLLALFFLIGLYQNGEENTRKRIYRLYLKNMSYINNWDLVDSSAEHIVGDFLFDGNKTVLYKLAKSKDLWERRIAIMSTFCFIKRNRYDDALKISEMLLEDKADLIHKAVGWMLREIGKRNLKTEENFLQLHYQTMPRTMLRYAIEKFSESKRQRYLKGKI
jgi:3-methyladenine DNA glycosylase AlkD